MHLYSPKHQQRLAFFARERLINLIRFAPSRKEHIFELFQILGCDTQINTFIVFEAANTDYNQDSRQMADELCHSVKQVLKEKFARKKHILFQMDKYKYGACVKASYRNGSEDLRQMCRTIIPSLNENTSKFVSFGIGSTMKNASEIGISYSEAVSAHGFASFFRHSQIVHVNDVQIKKIWHKEDAPSLAKLFSCIKSGKTDRALNEFNYYYFWLFHSSEGNLETMKMHCMHLVNKITYDFMNCGIQISTLARRSNQFLRDILATQNSYELTHCISRIIEQMISLLGLHEKSDSSETITRINNFIENNLNGELNSEIISRNIAISESSLRKLFKQTTGLSLGHYIQSIRVGEARKLLLETRKTISEIALELNFTSSSYFTSAFKKSEGLSPSAYRKSLKNYGYYPGS